MHSCAATISSNVQAICNCAYKTSANFVAMKVVHVIEAFEGGIIEFLRCLTYSTPDIEHTIIYGRHHFFENAYKTFPEQVQFIRWPEIDTKISLLKDAKALRHLIRILKTQAPVDIIHLHSAKAGILGRIAASKTGNKKVIYTPHGASFLRKDVSAFSRNAFAAIEKAAGIFPVKIIGVSKSEARAYNRIGIKATYVNNGRFFSEPCEKKQNENKFTVVTAGRAMQQKNPALFNQIASAFADHSNIRFVWIGDGIQKNLLTSPNIKITGWLEHGEVEKQLQIADVYMSTALWEGLSYAVLEAMSMCLPLLLTNCAGNIDLVEKGINGFLFNHSAQAIDFINQYINNRQLLNEHGQASFNMLKKKFNAEQMAEGYRQVYYSM